MTASNPNLKHIKIQRIEFRIMVQATESQKRVRQGLNFLGIAPSQDSTPFIIDEKELTKENLAGHFNNSLQLYIIKVIIPNRIKQYISALAQMNSVSKTNLSDTFIKHYTVEDPKDRFYFRLNKQKLLQNELELADITKTKDIVRVEINLLRKNPKANITLEDMKEFLQHNGILAREEK